MPQQPIPFVAARIALRRPARCLAGAVGLCAALLGCGSGGAPGAQIGASSPPPEYLIAYMRDWYYWYERLPEQIDPGAYADANAALLALKVPEDRFSYIETASTYNAFFDEGRALGFGFSYEPQTDVAAVRMVQPHSPIHVAGLRRGDRILSVDDMPVGELIAQGRLAESFGPVEVGVHRRLRLQRGADTLTIDASKDWYPISYVLASATIDTGRRRIGYLNFFSFATPGLAPWRAALDELLAQGAQDLIVDLRENGGGLLSVAATVGSALGEADIDGKIMDRLIFNTRHPEADRSFSFQSDPRAGRFDRIVWLTSGRTCSASEALIVGLVPWRATTRIGSTTCGKPVGFTPPTQDGWVYSIVSFSTENAAGFGAYLSGLAADCALTDPIAGEFGNAQEPMLAAAINWLESASCVSATATGKNQHNAHAGDPLSGFRGLSRLTGLR